MIVILLGPPGAGKGTQRTLLAEKLGIPDISTGELLRDAVAAGTPLGKLAQPYLDRGELVPDETMIGIVRERLLQPDARGGAIFDGFPRTLDQARALDRMLAALGRQIDRVVYLSVPDDVVVERTAARRVCDQSGGEVIQRPDDQPEVVRRRLEVYNAQTAPLIDFYRTKSVLAEVDGEQTVEDVQRGILDALARDVERVD
jgi:adenylate kinase